MSEHSQGLKIVTRLDDRCTAVPLQVQDNDKSKSEVHGNVRAWLKVKNCYKIMQEAHSSGTAGTRQ